MKTVKLIISPLLIVICSFGSLFAQKATISGYIKTSDGRPASQINLYIEGKGWSSVSQADGSYQINIPTPGIYTLIISALGIRKQEKQISVQNDEKLHADFVIELSYAELADVIVNASQSQLGNKLTYSVAKIPLKNLENPQVYSSVGSQLMAQQGLTNFDDAIRNVPGISRTWASTGRPGDGASYFALRGFEAQPSLYNSLPGFTSGDLDPANIEEIQVLKGPSGTLYGANFVGYGGVINVITKKPYFEKGGSLRYTGGSFGLGQITADYNTPLNDSLAFRIIADYHTENSFQDAGFKKSIFIAPSLKYNASDRLSFDFMAEIYHEKRAVAPVFFNTDRQSPLAFKDLDALNLDPKLSFSSNDLTIKNPRFNIQAKMNYALSRHWKSQTSISNSISSSDGYYSYIYGNGDADNPFAQSIMLEDQTERVLDIQQNFNADFKIGSIRNRLLLGLDYFYNRVNSNGSDEVILRYVTPQGEITQIDDANPLYATKASVDKALAEVPKNHSSISSQTFAAYLSDVINFTPSLSLMLSLRGDLFDNKGEQGEGTDNFTQFALSPKFGIVYQPIIDKLSLFANYQNSFINVAPVTVVDADGNNPHKKTFKPEHANQWEAGIKTSLLEDRLAITASYYNIQVENKVTPLADNFMDYDQRGKVRSRGVEIDFAANPVAGLNLIAGFSHNDIQNTTNGVDFYSEKGRVPGGQGPQDLVNFWGSYTLQKGKLKNFGIGLGANYAGIYKVADYSGTGVFELPSYTLLRASIFYNGKHFNASINGNNLLDKQYYIGYWSVNPQPPINYSFTIGFKL